MSISKILFYIFHYEGCSDLLLSLEDNLFAPPSHSCSIGINSTSLNLSREFYHFNSKKFSIYKLWVTEVPVSGFGCVCLIKLKLLCNLNPYHFLPAALPLKLPLSTVVSNEKKMSVGWCLVSYSSALILGGNTNQMFGLVFHASVHTAFQLF